MLPISIRKTTVYPVITNITTSNILLNYSGIKRCHLLKVELHILVINLCTPAPCKMLQK